MYVQRKREKTQIVMREVVSRHCTRTSTYTKGGVRKVYANNPGPRGPDGFTDQLHQTLKEEKPML